MRQKESGQSPGALPAESPLQRVVLSGVRTHVFLKREDLLLPAGGNKVRRFRAWIDTQDNAHTIAAMSDPGAHTFKVLQSFLDEPPCRNRIRRLLFLETRRPTNPYSAAIRARYLHDKRIQVLRGPVFLQLLRLQLLSLMPGVAAAGIGGSVRLSPNPFTEALAETDRQLAMCGHIGPVRHIFAVASGMMLDGFLALPGGKRGTSFVGVMTGHPITRRILAKKYRNAKSVTLVPPEPCDWNTYLEKAHEFHAQTGVWLDPVHTIHLLDAMEPDRLSSAEKMVLWITCPRIINKPLILEKEEHHEQ